MKKVVVTFFILIAVLIPTAVNAMSGDRVSLGYIYNASRSHTEIVNQSRGNLNTVSPTCFDLSTTGHLMINDIFSPEFVDDMHEQGIIVTPFLSNHWAKGKAQAALNHPDVLADELVEAIEQYRLDGVNIDLENLSHKDKDKLTEFMRILKEKMPEGKVLSIAVAANPYRWTTTWVAAYDYEALAEYADYLVLMAYDEHAQGGSAGPVASLPFVEKSVKAILEQVSRDKVVLGMPLYGRFWKEEAEEGGEAIIMAQVDRMASRYKNEIPRYDETTGTATLTITVESGDKKAYVNGRYLEEGIYTIWYENEKSFEAKLALMNTYGLKGAALWAISNESDDFWNYYEKGFQDDNYESEKQVQERIYYEQIERFMKEVKPLTLEKKIEITDQLTEALQEKEIGMELLLAQEKEEKIHLIEEKKENVSLDSKQEKIVEKEKQYKILEKFSITHMIKRYANE